MTALDGAGSVARPSADPGLGTHLLELLDWIGREPRTYRETIATWGSHCPRSTPWEDAQASGLVQVTRDGDLGGGLSVVLTERGQAALAAGGRC